MSSQLNAGSNPTAAVSALARSQHGIISHTQATERGLSGRQINYRVARGEWLRLIRGVYAVSGATISWLSWAWVAVLAVGPAGVLIGPSAASLRGWAAPTWPIYVALPESRRTRWSTERIRCIELTVPLERTGEGRRLDYHLTTADSC